MVTAYLVNHTHWDREWYFTTMDALVLSEQLFTEVLDELDRNPEANFTLDGQISVVDEYVEIHPEAQARIRKFVGEGRLFLGPWYTQTDALIPDAESIIRNLVIGMRDTQIKYGTPMKVGYLPDTFGFNAQMPTLLHQVGIDNMVFWRGTNFDRQVPSVYFRWRGLNGKEVYAANFPFGYFSGQITVESKRKIQQFINERYDPIAKFEHEHGNNDAVLMPSGIDQMNIIKNISDTVQELNKHSKVHTVLSTYPKFIESLRQRRDTLPEFSGELRLPTYARVHRTIGSVRHEIKRQNVLLEQKILKRIEPLAVIGRKSGISIGNGLLIKLWKKLLECQAHDTIGGSVSDNVTVDILHRFKEANEIADGIENMIKKKMAEYLQLTSDQILMFNTEPYALTTRKTVNIVYSSKSINITGFSDPVLESYKHYPERHHIQMMTPRGKEFTDEPEYYNLQVSGNVTLPGLGYKILTITNATTSLPELHRERGTSIAHGGETLSFVDGKFELRTVSGKRLSNILQLVDSANAGDTYDYSPLAGDAEQVLPFQYAERHTDGNHEVLVVTGAARLPKDLNSRDTVDSKYGSLEYRLTLSFTEDNLINVDLHLNNQVLSHRLRVVFSPEVPTDEVLAQIQAGFVTTRNVSIPDNWQANYDEKPVNLYNFDKSVSITDTNSHLTFFGLGEKEYEYADGKLYVTLLATTSELGKPDLAWRPGRASGDTTNQGHIMMPTPLAEEQGPNEFQFAFKLENSAADQSIIAKEVRNWMAPSVSYQKQDLNYFINRLDNKIWETEDNPTIPETLSLLTASTDLDVAAIYPSYSDPDQTIIRIQNLTSSDQLIPSELLGKGTVVNALEEEQDPRTTIPAYDLVSLKVHL
ncbi:glycoside hydrolase family 38 N-terminal domain-containing protein [Lacticaseibacillus pantheris]